MEVQFHYQVSVSIRNRLVLKSFIAEIFNQEGFRASRLSIVFCDDTYLLDINMRFLSHNYFTDIITFNYNSPEESIDGEIYISVDTVKSNAKHFNVSIASEIHRVIFHGVLHLCGYRDKTRKEQVVMKNMENYYLDLYKDFVSRNYVSG